MNDNGPARGRREDENVGNVPSNHMSRDSGPDAPFASYAEFHTGWRKLPTEVSFGLMNSIDVTIARALAAQGVRVPALQTPGSLILVSDYSGQHSGSPYEVYSYVATDTASWATWERRRKRLRAHSGIGRRRFSYKDLNDRVRRMHLAEFLASADALEGICISFAVAKSLGSLFSETTGDNVDPAIAPGIAALPSGVRERLFRVVHFASLLLSGLSQPEHEVTWFTDEDAIAPSDAGVCLAMEVMGVVCSHYLTHDIKKLRFGTTKCDRGDNQIEDLAAIADLAAGATGAMLTDIKGRGLALSRSLDIPLSSHMPVKARFLADWLSHTDRHLRRLSVAVEPGVGPRRVTVSGLRLGHSPAVLDTRADWSRS